MVYLKYKKERKYYHEYSPITSEQYQLWLQIKDVEINKLKYENEALSAKNQKLLIDNQMLRDTLGEINNEKMNILKDYNEILLDFDRLYDDYSSMMEWYNLDY